MDIPFTQFMMPNGRQKDTLIDRPENIGNMAKAVLSTGGRFTSEMLSTGMISLAYEKDVDGEIEDVDIEVVANGPGVPVAVDAMIERLHSRYIKEATCPRKSC